MKWPDPPKRRIDPAELFRVPLVWRVDSEHEYWLHAEADGRQLFMRINPAFPDTPLYSLLVDEDETFDFDDLPDTWRREGRLRWGTEGTGTR